MRMVASTRAQVGLALITDARSTLDRDSAGLGIGLGFFAVR
jgi:hypothetical protein